MSKSKQKFNDLDLNDLYKFLAEKRKKLVDLKLDLAQGKVKNIREIRQLKKDIARILTFINLKNKAKQVENK